MKRKKNRRRAAVAAFALTAVVLFALTGERGAERLFKRRALTLTQPEPVAVRPLEA